VRCDLKRIFVFWFLAVPVVFAGAPGDDKHPTIGPAQGWLIVHGGGMVTPEVK